MQTQEVKGLICPSSLWFLFLNLMADQQWTKTRTPGLPDLVRMSRMYLCHAFVISLAANLQRDRSVAGRFTVCSRSFSPGNPGSCSCKCPFWRSSPEQHQKLGELRIPGLVFSKLVDGVFAHLLCILSE